MKNINSRERHMRYIFILLFFFIFLFSFKIQAEKADILSKYTIDEENTYTVLINDLTKSYIEQLAKKQGATEAILITSFIKGNLNMSAIKEKVIPCLRKNNISIFSRKKIDLNVVEICIMPFSTNFENTLNKIFSQEQPHFLEKALIDFYIFDPQFKEPFTPKTMAEVVMIKQASSIAITRLDNQAWREKINTCVQQKKAIHPPKRNDKNLEDMRACTQPYFDTVSKEINNIIQDFKPYDSFFQMAVPFPNHAQMKQEFSKSGQMYQWDEK